MRELNRELNQELKQLASVELRWLVSELKHLESSWLVQVYDVLGLGSKPGKSLALQFRTSEGRLFMVCFAPYAVFFSSRKPSTGESPSSFCSLLRHHLANTKLLSISQPGSERILEFVFSSKNRQLKLLIELFSKGNVILVGEDGAILGAAEHQAWKDRTVRPGFRYVLPPASADFAGLSAEQFLRLVLSSGKDSVVKALAVDLGLSGKYAEQLCSSAAVDKGKCPSELSQQELDRLFSSLQKLLQPRRINADIEASLSKQLESAIPASMQAKYDRQIRELEITLEQQKAAVGSLSKAAVESSRAAEFIYEHYMEIRQLLDDYNKLRKTFTPQQLKDYFKSNKLVKDIDEKTGQVTIEIQ